jgi:hypothetical protein
MLEAFADVLFSELCKCDLQVFLDPADVTKSPSLQDSLRFKSQRVLDLGSMECVGQHLCHYLA